MSLLAYCHAMKVFHFKHDTPNIFETILFTKITFTCLLAPCPLAPCPPGPLHLVSLFSFTVSLFSCTPSLPQTPFLFLTAMADFGSHVGSHVLLLLNEKVKIITECDYTRRVHRKVWIHYGFLYSTSFNLTYFTQFNLLIYNKNNNNNNNFHVQSTWKSKVITYFLKLKFDDHFK